MRVGTSIAALVGTALAAALVTKVNEDGTVDAIAFPHGQTTGVLLTAIVPADQPSVEAGNAEAAADDDTFKDR